MAAAVGGAAGVPVVAEQWIDVEGRGEMGHYRLVIGFDDAAGELVVNDSYYGALRRHSDDDFERMWRPFVGAYVAVFRPEQEPAVRAAIGADWDDAAMWARARADHEAWAAGAPADAWAHFALGVVRARQADHPGAVEAFDRALRSGGVPLRTVDIPPVSALVLTDLAPGPVDLRVGPWRFVR